MKHQMLFHFPLVVFVLFFGVTGFADARRTAAEPARQEKPPAAPESVYTIQTGSFKDTKRAEQQFRVIEQSLEGKALQALRIELIGTVYAVRIGKFSSLAEAEQFLSRHGPGLKGAMVMKAHFIEKRIFMMHEDVKDVPGGETAAAGHRNLPEIPPAAHDSGLSLIGTVLSDEPGDSMAIIEILASGDQEVYKEGDTLQGILIKRILSRGVIIDNGQGDEILVMTGRTEADSLPEAAPPANTLPSEAPTVRIEQKKLDTAIPTRLHMVQIIRLKPYRQKGRVRGLKMYNVGPESIFAKMGFESGDVITAVKGRRVVVRQQIAQFYRALKEGGEVCVDIKRNDSDQKLCFEIR
jgi:type II secretion system protein C